MRRSILAVSCLLACPLAWTASALAAEATGQGATDLANTFHTYLGPARDGEPDFIRAEPDGDAYRITLDLGRYAAVFEPLGLLIEEAAVSFVVEPLDDGTWKVGSLPLPDQITAHFKDATTVYRFQGSTLEGLYDPSLPAFTRFDYSVASSDTMTIGTGMAAAAHSGEQTFSSTASGDADGGVDYVMHQTARDVATQQTILLPGSEASFDLSYSVQSLLADATADGVRTAALHDLWTYAVTALQETPPAFATQETRDRLLALLPLFQRFDETFALQGFGLATPIGAFGLDELSGAVRMAGIVEDGELSFSMKAAGASYPAELLPPWSADLMVDELQLGFVLSGFNAEAPARHLLSRLDVERDPPLEEPDLAALQELALPDGEALLTVEPGYLRGPVLSAEFSGEFRLNPVSPAGSLTVTLFGVDEATAIVGAIPDDPLAEQAKGLLALAKIFGRQTGGGATAFQIEFSPDGSVAVNGQLVRPPDRRPL